MVHPATGVLAGCTENDEVDSPELDEAALLQAVLAYSESLSRVNPEPLLSKHSAMVDVWVAPENVAQYESLGSSSPLPTKFSEGTLIVKNQLDEDLQPFNATVMYKAFPGYNPEVNDWWFATVDLRSGELDEAGPDLPSCVSCHSDVTSTDFVFGLP